MNWEKNKRLWPNLSIQLKTFPHLWNYLYINLYIIYVYRWIDIDNLRGEEKFLYIKIYMNKPGIWTPFIPQPQVKSTGITNMALHASPSQNTCNTLWEMPQSRYGPEWGTTLCIASNTRSPCAGTGNTEIQIRCKFSFFSILVWLRFGAPTVNHVLQTGLPCISVRTRRDANMQN